MTAIAYRDGVLAADSGTWSAGHRIGLADAKIVVGPGCMGAAAGGLESGLLFREWVRRGAEGRLDLHGADDFDAILVRACGTVHFVGSKGVAVPVDAPWHAPGAAERFLLGAMAAGASAVQAVRLAKRHTDFAAGPVRAVILTNGCFCDAPAVPD